MNTHKVRILENDVSVDMVIQDTIDSGTEEAFYICDVGSVVRQHMLWLETMPRVQTYYAIKCNNDDIILRTVASLGINFDCASQNEINKVLSLGVSPSRIVFSNSVKPRVHLKYAKNVNVNLMTVDSESELKKISKLFPDARLLLRIQCDDPSAAYHLGDKFGCEPETEAPRMLSVAKELGLNIAGVHFHIGSKFTDPEYLIKALTHAKDLFDIAKRLGFKPHILDIGGGFSGTDEKHFREVAEVANQGLNKLFPENDMVNIIAEPGRFYVETCSTLITNVTCARTVVYTDRSTGQHKEKDMYYIDDGVYGSFLVSIYEDVIKPIPMKLTSSGKVHNNHEEELFDSCVWGPTCDNSDLAVKKCKLPKLQEGDWIRFNSMGAYGIACSSSFNGFPLPKIHYVAHHKYWPQLTFLHYNSEEKNNIKKDAVHLNGNKHINGFN